MRAREECVTGCLAVQGWAKIPFPGCENFQGTFRQKYTNEIHLTWERKFTYYVAVTAERNETKGRRKERERKAATPTSESDDAERRRRPRRRVLALPPSQQLWSVDRYVHVQEWAEERAPGSLSYGKNGSIFLPACR